MKTNNLFKSILFLCLVFSCSQESLVEDINFESNVSPSSDLQNSSARSAMLSGGNLIPVLITDNENPNMLSGPTVYVSAGVDIKNYNRRVTVTILSYENEVLLDQVNVVIPANQSLSNFTTTIECFGVEPANNNVLNIPGFDVDLIISSVLNMSTNQFEYDYNLQQNYGVLPFCPEIKNPKTYIFL